MMKSVSFNLSDFEARIALGAVLSSDLPTYAIEALAAGKDGPIIRRMAGLTNPSGYEVDSLRPKFLDELGACAIAPDVAAIRLASTLARQFLDKPWDIRDALARIERLWLTSDHPAELSDLAMLADELDHDSEYRRSEGAITNDALREMRALVACNPSMV